MLSAVAVVSLVSAAHSLLHNPRELWAPDTQIYLRMTLEDRGLDRQAALTEANRIMLANVDPTVPGEYSAHPPGYFSRQFDLYRNRPLYPAVAAALYPLLGTHTLQYISVACYVLAALAMFGILLLYVPPWLAAVGGVATAMAPTVLQVAAVGVTDSAALLFWILTVGAILLYLRRPSNRLLLAVGVGALLLAFTRPAIYLPIGAALGVLFIARADRRARADALRLLGVTVSAAAIFMVVNVLVHGPGVVGQLNWVYSWQHQIGATSHGFAGWYVRAVAAMVGHALTYDIYESGAILILALAAFGAIIARGTPLVAIAIGAACASPVALLVNPVEFIRTVELPLTPLIILLATCALGSLVSLAPWRAMARDPDAGPPAGATSLQIG